MPSTASSLGSESVNYDELAELMGEFPDWKEQFPCYAQELFPHRFLKNKSNQPQHELIQRRTGSGNTVPLTDYQAKFQYNGQTRPRSTKKPPQSPRDPRPPPMAVESSQKAEYPPKFAEFTGRPPLMKKEEVYNPPTEPFDTMTAYKLDYPPRQPASRQLPPRPQGQLDNSKRVSEPFVSMTTSKEFYKQWPAQNTLCFKELPTFTGSVLYPGSNRHLETTTNSTFTGKTAPRVQPIHAVTGNISIEGDRDFNTTNALTYTKYEGQHRPEKMMTKQEYNPQTRSKFADETQFKYDFGHSHQGHDRAKPIAPPPATLDLKFNNRFSFETEQKKQFMGIDVSKHPVPKSYKPDTEEYKLPDVKFESQTKHMLDYQPIDVKSVYVPSIKPASQKHVTSTKFGGPTTTQEFYRPWPVQPRVNYGDSYEALQYLRSDIYVPRAEKFKGTTTTGDTFTTKTTDIPKPFIPSDENNVSGSGVMDFATVYRTEFQKGSIAKSLSKKQAAHLLKELRKRKGVIGKPLADVTNHTVAA